MYKNLISMQTLKIIFKTNHNNIIINNNNYIIRIRFITYIVNKL